MDTWLSEYAVLDIVESIKQLESLGGGNILSIYMYTFSGACNLYRDRKMSVNRWVAIGKKTLLRTKLRGPWLLTDSLLGFRLQTSDFRQREGTFCHYPETTGLYKIR